VPDDILKNLPNYCKINFGTAIILDYNFDYPFSNDLNLGNAILEEK